MLIAVTTAYAATSSRRALQEEKGWQFSGPVRSAEKMMIEKIAGIDKLVIDPGHGGYDPGLPGEKELVLELARRLEEVFTQKGTEVVLTRTSNRYLTLPERVELVIKENPNLFISLHVGRRFFSVFNMTSKEVLIDSIRIKNRIIDALSTSFGADKVLDRRFPVYLADNIPTPGVVLEVPSDIDFTDAETRSALLQAIVFSITENEPELSLPYTEETGY